MTKLDRLTRSLDFASIVQDAQQRDWTLIVLDQGFDHATANGRAMAGTLAVFAQWEREIIGQRTSAALQVKIKGGWACLAWELRVPRVVRRRIAKMAQAGMSQRAIANQLNADGVPAAGGCWHRGTVIRVLRQAAAVEPVPVSAVPR